MNINDTSKLIELNKIVKNLCLVYNKPNNEIAVNQIAESWVNSLRDYDIQPIIKAFDTHIKTGKFWPRPYEIINLMAGKTQNYNTEAAGYVETLGKISLDNYGNTSSEYNLFQNRCYSRYLANTPVVEYNDNGHSKHRCLMITEYEAVSRKRIENGYEKLLDYKDVKFSGYTPGNVFEQIKPIKSIGMHYTDEF